MDESSSSMFLLKRQLVSLSSSPSFFLPSSSSCCGFVQWNLLADHLSDAFPQVKKEHLQWSHRRPLLLQELKNFLSLGFVVCAEEVDHAQELHAELPQVDLFFSPKKNNSPDGCAIFVPRSSFRVVGCDNATTTQLLPSSDKEGSSQIALSIHLLHEPSQQHFFLCCTHLKAKEGFEEVRHRQAEALVSFLESNRRDNESVIVCGDFNDIPSSLAAQTMQQHGFTSAYNQDNVRSLNCSPFFFTTSKTRGKTVTRCIDYIWFKGSNIHVEALLNIPNLSSLEPTHLPLPDFPSDHLSICAVFSQKK